MRKATALVLWLVLLLVPQVAGTAYCFGQGNETAPDFSIEDLQGQKHSLSEYKGRVVVLNFWASWCPECIEEISSLNMLYEKYNIKGLVVIGISSDRRREPVESIIKQTHALYPMLIDTTGGALLRRYRIIGLPNTVIIDKKGFISERIIGRTDFSSPLLEKKIESLLSK